MVKKGTIGLLLSQKLSVQVVFLVIGGSRLAVAAQVAGVAQEVPGVQ